MKLWWVGKLSERDMDSIQLFCWRYCLRGCRYWDAGVGECGIPTGDYAGCPDDTPTGSETESLPSQEPVRPKVQGEQMELFLR